MLLPRDIAYRRLRHPRTFPYIWPGGTSKTGLSVKARVDVYDTVVLRAGGKNISLK